MELVSVATAIMLYSLGLHQAPGGAEGQDPLVMIRQGSLRGIKVYTEEGRLINAFLGVPYAAPPVGDLRFAPPVRHEGWNRSTSLFAGKFAPACPQVQPAGATISVPQDEDCLYLNIWTPESVSAAYRGGAPVVVFLEGEGFVSGLASRFPAQDLAAEGVIVISASYRLNVFGFFCLEDEVARGNLGLLDQYFALLWVRENVEAFGGDPRSVTLMGHSAGAASVVYHMTSPRTSGLFHRAIIMSGSVASPWSGIRHPRNSSRAIARSLGCFAPTSRTILTCLRSKSVPEILRAFEAQYKNGNWTELVLPVVDTFLPKDEQYLPRDPVEVLESGNFLGIPILTGTASHEGVVTLYQWGDLARQTYTQLRNFFERSALPGVIERYGFSQSPYVRDTLLWWYVDRARDGDTTALLNSLLQLYSDAEFVAPHARQMELLSRSPEPMYVYRFQASGGPDLYGNTLNISGTAHGSEFLYLMGPTLMSRLGGRRFTRDEDIFSKRVKRFWVDFIRQGNPNPAGSFGYSSQWQRAIPGDHKCFALQLGTGSCGDEGQEAARLWNDLLPHLAQSPPSPPPKKAPDPQLGTGGNGQPFRSAMYILVGFVIVLLVLLIICLVLLKRHAKERERDLF